MQIHPEDAEDFVDILIQRRQYTEAVQKYIEILNNPRFKSKDAKGPFQFLTEMMELMIDHAREVRTDNESGIDVERIIRSGVQRFSDQRGILWVGLARYWINRGNHERLEIPLRKASRLS